jgi:hypothetical protein
VGRSEVRLTTKRLVSRTESVALLAQASWIATTAYVDKVTPQGQRFLLAVAVVHTVAAAVAYMKGGPFVHGGGWKVVWIGLALLTPFVMGNLVPYGEYGSSPSCVQLCGYPVPAVVFLAFYPWTGLAFSHMRRGLEVLLLFGFIAGPMIVIAATHDFLTRDNMVSLLVTSSIYLLAFGLGQFVGRICREATQAQTEAAEARRKTNSNGLTTPCTTKSRPPWGQRRSIMAGPTWSVWASACAAYRKSSRESAHAACSTKARRARWRRSWTCRSISCEASSLASRCRPWAS